MTAAATAKQAKKQQDIRALFDRYHHAWESADADAIAALHSLDSTFWLQDGSPRIQGRETLRKHYTGLFAQYGKFGWDIQRVMFGDRHWVFEYNMLIEMKDCNQQPFTASVPMLDIVDVNEAGEVTRKDVYVDGAARRAALERAGLVSAS